MPRNHRDKLSNEQLDRGKKPIKDLASESTAELGIPSVSIRSKPVKGFAKHVVCQHLLIDAILLPLELGKPHAEAHTCSYAAMRLHPALSTRIHLYLRCPGACPGEQQPPLLLE